METLFNGLEIITQGQLGNLGGATAAQMVRRVQAMSINHQIPIEKLISMGAQNSGLASQMGLASVFGTQATEQSIAFRKAWGQSGVNGGFNGENLDTATDSFARRNLGASNSIMANNLAAIVNMSDGGLVRKDSPLARIAEAIKTNKSTISLNGRQVDVGRLATDRDQIYQLAEQSGIQNAGTVTSMLGSRRANQETIFRNNIGGFVTPYQKNDVARYESDVLAGAAGTAGITGAGRVAVGEALQRFFANASDDLSKNPAAMNAAAANFLRKSGIADIAGMNQGQLLELAQSASSQLDNAHRRDQLFGPNRQSVKNQHFNRNVQGNLANALQADKQFAGAMGTAAGVNATDLVTRGASMLGTGATIGQLIARAAGAVDANDPRVQSVMAGTGMPGEANGIRNVSAAGGVGGSGGGLQLSGTLTVLGNGKVGISATANNKGSVPAATP